MKIVYPACFYKQEDESYSVEIPDLLGCCTQGRNLIEAMEMAEDAALGWLLTAIEDEENIPEPSNIEEVELQETNGFKTLLLLDIDQYTEKYGTKKAVKKTLTIPEWLNKRAEVLGVNFSQTLQEALLMKILKLRKK